VLSRMSESHVMESRTGAFHRPSSMSRVPLYMLDRFMNPIFGDISDHLSLNYHVRDSPLIESLGVKVLSWKWFFEQLNSLDDVSLSSKDKYWHEDLAKCMILHYQEAEPIRTQIRSKKLIPLEDGSWISAEGLQQRPSYFGENADTAEFPLDINLSLVAFSASENPWRKSFFELLGVKYCKEQEVAKLIMKRHQDKVAPSIENAIAHIKYLYALHPKITKRFNIDELWFYDSNGLPARSYNLYTHISSPAYDPDLFFQGFSQPARFLSPKYHELKDKRTGSHVLVSWLLRHTALTQIPRLRLRGSESLSPEFVHVMKNTPEKVLDILKRHWFIYCWQMTPEIRNRIGSHVVVCSNGGRQEQRMLKDTFAPTPELRKISLDICQTISAPFLKLNPFNAPEWQFLSTFGVGMTADLRFYLGLAKQATSCKDYSISNSKKLLFQIAKSAGPMTGVRQELL
jgi:hypothetical protein